VTADSLARSILTLASAVIGYLDIIYSYYYQRDPNLESPGKGPSTRVRTRARFHIRVHARFAGKADRGSILLLTPITMVCLHIKAKQITKFNCEMSLAANRKQNRTQNCTCRRAPKAQLGMTWQLQAIVALTTQLT
jgi:hypothetical protein